MSGCLCCGSPGVRLRGSVVQIRLGGRRLRCRLPGLRMRGGLRRCGQGRSLAGRPRGRQHIARRRRRGNRLRSLLLYGSVRSILRGSSRRNSGRRGVCGRSPRCWFSGARRDRSGFRGGSGRGRGLRVSGVGRRSACRAGGWLGRRRFGGGRVSFRLRRRRRCGVGCGLRLFGGRHCRPVRLRGELDAGEEHDDEAREIAHRVTSAPAPTAPT